MAEPIIKLVDASKSFGDKPVLRGASLEVHKGESVVIIGRSGSGKSVTLKLILGMIEPDIGEVFVSGVHVNRTSDADLYPVRKKIGMLFQNAALWDSLSVFDNVALALRQHQWGEEEQIRERVYDCLDQVGLEDMETPGREGLIKVANRFPAELSGGMRKRVGLARAIAPQPDIMLYDEPTTGLDPIMSGIIDRLISNLHKEMGVTSLAITHDMHSALTIADRLVMLHRGVYSSLGTADEALISDDPVVRQFLHGADGPIKPKYTDHIQPEA